MVGRILCHRPSMQTERKKINFNDAGKMITITKNKGKIPFNLPINTTVANVTPQKENNKHTSYLQCKEIFPTIDPTLLAALDVITEPATAHATIIPPIAPVTAPATSVESATMIMSPATVDKISPNFAIYESVYSHQNNSPGPPP